ncbi:MAG: amino acid-binding protein [Acidithiobacillales bacterium SG8_45]|nr:MAG: amino acid-binding protein [Acidithiobacillales bacterium SG8_45]
MSDWYMVTVVGHDQPGIVAKVTHALSEGGWGLGESSMTRLGGNFTIMMMVGGVGDEAALAQVVEPAASALGLHVHIDRIQAEMHQHPNPNVHVRVYGADRTGIVADVTGRLATAGLTILDLNSEVGGTSDEPVYVMVLDGFVENGIDALDQALADLSNQGLKIDVEPVDVMMG